MPPGMAPGQMPPAPTPTPSTPTPAPAAQAPKPTPAPVPTMNGTVVVAFFSDVIATGGEAPVKAASMIDWDKVEAALKRVEGVSSASLDATSRRINVSYTGQYKDIDKIRTAVQNAGVSSELLNPAKMIFRPMGEVDDGDKLASAIKGVAGVTMATREFNDIHFYADLATLDMEKVIQAALGSGVKGQITTHELIKVGLTSGGDAAKLVDELEKTKWVLKAEIDASTNSVKVLSVKGRVTRTLVKQIMTKCGYPEGK
jgi:copper chaperone CopZ